MPDQTTTDQAAERCQVNNDPGGWTDPKGNPPKIFTNSAQSCTFTCPDGLPFTYTVPAGAYSGLNQILVNRIALSFACRFAAQNSVCMSSLDDDGCLGTDYFDTLIPSGTAPFTFTITQGALPPGLTLTPSPTAAILSGKPTVAGLFSFQIRVVDARGNFMQKTFSISIVSISNSLPLPQLTTGNPYSVQLNGIGGTGPYTFAVTAGTLPPGLTLSSSGLISGTPTSNATDTVTITITDAADHPCPISITFTGATSKNGWRICDWATVLSKLVGFGQCKASAQPAWDGIFDLETTTGLPAGDQEWYFTNQSISNASVAASSAPHFPNGAWQLLDCFTSLYYQAFSGTWELLIACADDCSTTEIWFGTMVNHNPNDATGQYANDGFGTSANPAFIQISKTNATTAPDWSQILWSTVQSIPGNGTATFTPSNAPGQPFDCKCTSANITGVNMPSESAQGFLNYTGPAKNAKVSVAWTGSPKNASGGAGSVNVWQITPGGALILVASQNFGAGSADGNYDIAFSLPNTGGDCWKIRVDVATLIIGNNGFVAGTAELSGSIINT